MRLKRTRTCGELRGCDAGQEVILNGWVDRIRKHGPLVFLELRDRHGFTQVVGERDKLPLLMELKPEWVVAVRGKVQARPEENLNPAKPTGEIDLLALEVEILNTAKMPPFEIKEVIPTKEEQRLEYRYLDMRRRCVLEATIFRSRLTGLITRVFHEQDFIQVETPILMKTSPEGARDFIVPTRFQPGFVYGLPQSPQLFKQTLMVAGLDRYFQICKCFRDEDLRADRQPEFTQLDMEMSFVRPEDVFSVIEELMVTAYGELLGVELARPFPRISYREALERYGSDKPDTRFGLELSNVSALFVKSPFELFRGALAAKGVVAALRVPGGGSLSRKQIEELEGVAREYGARGLPWMRVVDAGVSGGVARRLQPSEVEGLRSSLGLEPGDLVVFCCGAFDRAHVALGQVRLRLGTLMDLIPKGRVDPLWVTDFPLFEWHPDEQRFQTMHHMFTAPRDPLPEPGEDLSQVRADLYDLVINGSEIGSGSIRIHQAEVQRKVFQLVGLDEQRAQDRFGWFLRALEHGAPPHGGIALGLDRLAMIMLGCSSLREVIAFPKTTSGACPLTDSPSPADPEQWRELGLSVVASRDQEPLGP